MTHRLVHIHVPKAAGNSVRNALAAHYAAERIFSGLHEPDFGDIAPEAFDFFSGHIGFDLAQKLDAEPVVILRDPVDRFLSVYHYWQERYHRNDGHTRRGPILATHLPIEEFAERFDEPALTEELFNRMTWQMAWSHLLERRRKIAHDITHQELLARALANLERCAVVGFSDQLDIFASRCESRFGAALTIGRDNVTQARSQLNDISPALRTAIERWMPLDIALFSIARDRWGAAS